MVKIEIPQPVIYAINAFIVAPLIIVLSINNINSYDSNRTLLMGATYLGFLMHFYYFYKLFFPNWNLLEGYEAQDGPIVDKKGYPLPFERQDEVMATSVPDVPLSLRA